MLTKPISLRQVPHSLTAKQKLVVTLLAAVLCTIPLWLGLQRVHSAPAGFPPQAPAPAPIVSIDVPGEVLIGEDFQFEVTFRNGPGAGVGYGPYIEVYLPARGADSNAPDSTPTNQKCDGISFVSAATSFANPPTVALPPTYKSLLSNIASDLDCSNGYSLPFTGMTTPVGPLSGDYQLVVIELPFGSFDQSQPAIVVNVTAHLSDFADASTPLQPSPPLTLYARGGFRYGNDALDNPPQLLQSVLVSDQTTPTVFKLKKGYFGPEDEAVSGPNFINYYPLKYGLTADIADQQKVKNLLITDNLPGNLQFAGNVKVVIKNNNAIPVGICPANPGSYDVVISPPLLPQGGTLSVKLCSPVTGTIAPDDVVITFDFYIPEKDAGGQDILDKDCKNSSVPVKNDILAKGDWDPLDPRDPSLTALPGATVPVDSNLTNVDHVLQAKCLAIQKKVTQPPPDTGGPGLTPGDTLRYELNFQVSDYRSIGKIVVTDFLSDGQKLVGLPSLTVVGDQFGSYSNLAFNATTFSETPDANISCPDLGGITGGTILTFKVSDALAAAASGGPITQVNGILIGGHAAGPISPVPAIGQIVFFAQIQDKFKYQFPLNFNKVFVDKHDPLNNCVSIEGQVYQNEVPPTVPFSMLGKTGDGSGSQVRIAMEKPRKTVYAVKSVNNSITCGPAPNTACLNLPGTPQEVHPGDKVTFRIEYSIPSGDAEALQIEDWLPLPIFNVDDPDATPPPGLPTWPIAVPLCTVPAPYVPVPGKACRLTPLQAPPGHTLPKIPIVSSGTANNLVFNYGTFNNPLNTSWKIDLLFTITVTNQPFADGLFLTNEARESERNTFGPVPPQVTIAQVKLREPKLRIRKGVIATNNPKGQFSQPASPPTPPNPTALAPPNATLSLAGISGIVNTAAMVSSNDLAAGILDSNLPGGVDANDIVTFAITIENVGGAPAYDVKVQDIIPHDINNNPTCFTIVPNSFQVKRGTGAVVASLLYSITTTATGFTVATTPNLPIPINAYDPANGKNIIVITFRAKLLANVTPGCCDNKAKLLHYASQVNGPNFVSAGFTPPFEDLAEVCVKPKAEKCVTATSEAHTQADNSVSGTPQPPQVTIGEIIRYHLTVTVPEGVSPFFKLTDHLPPGLTYMPGTAKVAFVSTLGITSSAVGLSGVGMPDPGSNYTLGCLKPTPTVVIPSGLVTPTLFTAGDDPTFGLGTITNNDNDGNLEYVVIEFNALVNNISTNVDTVTPRNNYEIFAGQIPVAIAKSNDSDVTIVEPRLTMTKTVAPNPAIKGQTLTYTVQFTNNGTADAFEVELKDTLPSGLTFGTIAAGCPFTTSSNLLTVTCAKVPKAPSTGSTVLVTYQAVANPASCPVSLENRANLTWTSLPGPKGTIVNQTGSSTPGNSGLADGERDGVTVPLSVNYYVVTASAAVKIDCPCNATINGVKFEDLNGNQVQDSNEQVLPGWTIELKDSGGNILQTAITDSQGSYSFTVPAPGSYKVSEVLKSGWTRTTPTSGNHNVNVSPGQVVNNRDFGNKPKAGPSACATPPPGMVAWWPLDDPTGDTVVDDIAGAPDNGSPKPGPAIGPASPSSLAAVVGTGLNFLPSISPTGPNHYVNVATSPEMNFGTGDFTIDAWIKLNQASNVHPLVDKFDFSTPGTNKGYALFVQGGQLLLQIAPDAFGGVVTRVSTGPLITPGTWHHIAVTVRRNDVSNKPVITFYINGVLSGSGTPAGPLMPGSISIDSTTPLWIGGNSRLASGGATISLAEIAIDELEFFKRELSQTEIQSIFNAKSAGKCKCLAATNEKITCNPNGTFSYALTVTNLSSSTVSFLTFSPATSNVTITPSSMTIPPLAPGGSTNVTVTIGGTGAVSGANVCFDIGGGPVGAVGCKSRHCITLPTCPASGSLTVTKTVKNLSPIPVPVTNFPITVSCLPSGPNVTLTLAAGGTQTVNNIPVGSTCTVTEALPPPIPHPACASLGWGTPTYAPGDTVSIPSTGGSQTVTVTNYYSCNPTLTCATPPPGMVGWWPLDEPNGSTVVNDIAGFNNQGTPKVAFLGGSPLGSINAPNAVPGEVGGAVNFKSNLQLNNPVPASHIEVADHDEIDFGTGHLSIDAWVRMPRPPPVDVASIARLIVGKLKFGVSSPRVLNATGYALYLVASSSGASLQFSMGDGGPLAFYRPNTPPIPFDTWTHVAVTVDRTLGTVTFYVNGKAVPSTTAAMPSGSISNDVPLSIGGSYAFGTNTGGVEFPNFFLAIPEESLDEIEVFSRVLTPVEVDSIFRVGTAGKCKATISGLKFNDLNGNHLRDKDEGSLPKWTIKLTDSNGKIQTTTTDAQGNYSFTVPAPGTYTISEEPQPGWMQTAPTSGTYAVTVTPGQAVNDRNFGNQDSTVHKREEVKVDPKKLPDLGIKKEAQCTPTAAGVKCKIGLTITNNGPGAFNGFLGVQDVVTPAPAQLTLAPGSNPPGWNCNVSPPNAIGCASTSAVKLVPLRSAGFGLEVYISPGEFKNCARVKGYTQAPFSDSTLIQDGAVNNNESCVSMSSQARQADVPGRGLELNLAVNTQINLDLKVQNRCRQEHKFKVTVHGLHFLTLLDSPNVIVPGAGSQNLAGRFDTTGIKPGEYKGNVEVDCVDCSKEKKCEGYRQTTQIRVTVRPVAGSPGR